MPDAPIHRAMNQKLLFVFVKQEVRLKAIAIDAASEIACRSGE